MLSDGIPAQSRTQIQDIDRVIAASNGAGDMAPPLKKRGGKRPGAGRKPLGAKAPDPVIEKINSDLGAGLQDSETHSENPGNQTAGTETSPSFDIPPMLLIPAVKFLPFGLMAAKTGFDGFNLSDAEAEGMAPLLAAIVNQYAPKIDPKHLPLIMYGGAVATMLLQKSAAFSVWKRNQTVKPSDPNPIDPAPNVYHPPESKAA